ncbi:No apical meristem (NAM) protein [Corchorus capsularis]|uniref:No apical meristem (NAM) protein n=1 Tax=Corchorus capsularis TaxID=210143 RepID=A0A1R3GQE4_COCAP|nr:No apical meristem (NAM) protein [Corchorus capsularis]
MSMARGVRFRPEEEEIFCHYLYPFINGDSIPYEFGEIDIYGGENKEPWNLFKWNEDSPQTESFWVFTRLRKKSASKIDRIAGCGSWNQKGKRNEVRDSEGRLLGYEKYYIFKGKKDSDDPLNLKWMMHEYSVEPEGSGNLVFCQIKYELNKKRKRSDDLDDEYQGSSSSSVKKIGLDLDCQNNHQNHPVPILVISQNKNQNEEVILEELPVDDADHYLQLPGPAATDHVTYELNPVDPSDYHEWNPVLIDNLFNPEPEPLLDNSGWDWRSCIIEHNSISMDAFLGVSWHILLGRNLLIKHSTPPSDQMTTLDIKTKKCRSGRKKQVQQQVSKPS